MKSSLGILSLLCVSIVLIGMNDFTVQERLHLVKWPKPTYNFKQYPVTEDGFQLGRVLFYDPILSRDSSISCADCHLQYTGFAHVDHQVSHGIDGRKGTRNAPALVNLAWKTSFHWDGGVSQLHLQFINPIEHPSEMDNKLTVVLERLRNQSFYRQRFKQVFGNESITTMQFLSAMAQFVVSLESKNSTYDRVMRKEKGVSFTKQEKNGYLLFKQHCNACHTEPLFTQTFFANNGLPVDPNYDDIGRFAITNRSVDSFLFMIPTLRNIEYTFPYMHDGRFAKLKDVINHYVKGIDRSTKNLHQKLRKPIPLNEQMQKDLIAFLKTLTDKEFLYNKRFSFPKELLSTRK
jgi:cytochrome c peroxidase